MKILSNSYILKEWKQNKHQTRITNYSKIPGNYWIYYPMKVSGVKLQIYGITGWGKASFRALPGFQSL